MYRDHYDGHAPYGSYGNGYSEGRRTTRRRLLPATPTGERISPSLFSMVAFVLLFLSVSGAAAHCDIITADRRIVFVYLSPTRSETIVQHPVSEAARQQ